MRGPVIGDIPPCGDAEAQRSPLLKMKDEDGLEAKGA
jgi:hypothetical protein